MNETTIEIIALVTSFFGLLAWVIHKVIDYFIQSAKDKMAYIENLVAQNQKNTDAFLNAVNHQQTLNREAQEKSTEALRELKLGIEKQNEVTGRLLDYIEKKS